MEAKNNLEARLAGDLARPFLLPGQTGQPLSFRALPDGGMVVIAADGRKLWFTCREVNVVRQKMRAPAVKPTAANDGLRDEDFSKPSKYTPHARFREGDSEMIILPPDLKHLERDYRDQPDFPGRPRPSTPK
jgi:hypothetical protein